MQEKSRQKTHLLLIGESQTAFHGTSGFTPGIQAYLPGLQQARQAGL